MYGAADLHAATVEWLGPLPAHAGEARALTARRPSASRFDGLLYDDPRDPAARARHAATSRSTATRAAA